MNDIDEMMGIIIKVGTVLEPLLTHTDWSISNLDYGCWSKNQKSLSRENLSD